MDIGRCEEDVPGSCAGLIGGFDFALEGRNKCRGHDAVVKKPAMLSSLLTLECTDAGEADWKTARQFQKAKEKQSEV